MKQTIDIGIIFDISNNLKNIIDLFVKSENDYQFYGIEILNILEKFCNRGISTRNEEIRIFAILSGGKKEQIYDFCNLIEIASNKFNESGYGKNNKFLNNIAFSVNQLFKSLDSDKQQNDINYLFQNAVDIFTSNIFEPKRKKEKKKIKSVKFLNGNDLLDIIEIIIEKIHSVSNWSKFFDLDLNFDIVHEYIYGNSSLETAMNLAINTFKEKSKDNYNFLFVISGGDLKINQSDIQRIQNDSLDSNIIIWTFFLTDNKNKIKNKLYDDEHPIKNAQNLFEVTTTLSNVDPFIKFLAKKYDIPDSGNTKLFVEVNKENLISIIDLFNEATIELNNLYIKEIRDDPKSLINLISNTIIDSMTQEIMDKFEPLRQAGKTCYANAISAALFMLSNKLLGKRKFSIEKLKKKI